VANKTTAKKQIHNIDSLIQRAVKAGIEAGRTQAEHTSVDAYRATERRLYALPTLVHKVEDARQHLEELEQTGPPEKSKDIVRFSRPGVRLTPSEILEALVTDIKASMAADEYEIEMIKKALKNIEEDACYLAVKGRYFEGISDDEIAKAIPCESRTVRRHRGRLVRVVAVWLYGAQAV
jgi:DNA-directed RNA polymerase specialized sigma24 family protein